MAPAAERLWRTRASWTGLELVRRGVPVECGSHRVRALRLVVISVNSGATRSRCGRSTESRLMRSRKRVWERASQPLVPSRFPSHDRPQRRGPERGGPERDSGPSR